MTLPTQLEVREIASGGSESEDLREAFSILKELRPVISWEEFLTILKEASQRDEFKLFGAFSDGECVAVMGCRVLYDYVHGKHLYIDDLVVTSNKRSLGLGKVLLEKAKAHAIEHGCQSLRLCTGVDNIRGQKFYEKNGWEPKAYAYKKPLAR